jgi:hypothetical protein
VIGPLHGRRAVQREQQPGAAGEPFRCSRAARTMPGRDGRQSRCSTWAGPRRGPLPPGRGRPAARAAPLCRPGRANTAPQSPTPSSSRPCTLHHQEQQPVAQRRCTVQAGKGARALQRATGSNGGLHQKHRRPDRTGLIDTEPCTPIVVSTDSASGAGCRSFPLRAELGPGAAQNRSVTGRRRQDDRGAAPRGSAAHPALEALCGAVSASDGLDRRSGARRASGRRRRPYGAGKDSCVPDAGRSSSQVRAEDRVPCCELRSQGEGSTTRTRSTICTNHYWGARPSSGRASRDCARVSQ